MTKLKCSPFIIHCGSLFFNWIRGHIDTFVTYWREYETYVQVDRRPLLAKLLTNSNFHFLVFVESATSPAVASATQTNDVLRVNANASAASYEGRIQCLVNMWVTCLGRVSYRKGLAYGRVAPRCLVLCRGVRSDREDNTLLMARGGSTSFPQSSRDDHTLKSGRHFERGRAVADQHVARMNIAWTWHLFRTQAALTDA